MGAITFITSFLALALFCSVSHTSAQELTIIPEPTSCDTLSVCYAIDDSASISDFQFDQQIEAIVDITKSFSSKSFRSSFSAVAFTDTANPTIVSSPTSDISSFISSLEGIVRRNGGTGSGYGLSQCAKLLEDTPSPRVIVLITDGEDNTNILPEGNGQYVAGELKARNYVIATIGVGSGTSNEALKMIASTENLYTSITSFGTFADSVDSVVVTLCTEIEEPSPLPTEEVPTPSPTETVPPCNSMLLCFAVDETTSIETSDFKLEIDAVLNISESISVRSPKSFYGAAGFADAAHEISPMTDIASFLPAVENNVQKFGNTASGTGLRECERIINGHPSSASLPKVVVLITDGTDNREPAGAAVATDLKNKGFIVGALGVGDGIEDGLDTFVTVDSLYKNVSDFATLGSILPEVVESLCSLPEPAPASPTPSPSTSPSPYGRTPIVSESDIPPFDVTKTREENGELLRAAFEFYLSQELGRGALIRVELYFESAESDLFPWNVLNGDYYMNLKNTPTATPYNYMVDSGRQQQHGQAGVSMGVTDRQVRTRLKECPASWCASRVEMYSNRYIGWKSVKNALVRVRKRAGFKQVFSLNISKYRIVRKGPRFMIAFVPFKFDPASNGDG